MTAIVESLNVGAPQPVQAGGPPCFKLGLRMGEPRSLKTFAAAGRPGASLQILRERNIGAR